MAYIPPNSTVEIFGDLGLSPTHDDTLYFASTGAKDSYFSALNKLGTYSNLSYSRRNRGVIRLQAAMSTLVGASYMRFKNTSFENKWFYAFVTAVEYVNNVTTDIFFEVDVIMTWMGAFTLGQCYVERQHVTNDSIGANIADEGLKCGEYVCEGSSTTALFGTYYVCVYKAVPEENPDVTEDQQLGFTYAALTQGTYSALEIAYFPLTIEGIGALKHAVTTLTEDHRADEIIMMRLVPYYFCDFANGNIVSVPFTVEKPYTSVGGYVPRNNKLYCYPYKYLEVVNCEGSENNYKYEYFNTLPDATSTGDATFNIEGTADTPEVNIMCIPSNYIGKQYDYENAITMQNFPTIAWNVDGYKAYLAQRDSTLFGEAISGMIVGGLNGAVTGAVGGNVSGIVHPKTLMTPGLGAITGAIGGAISGLSKPAKTLLSDTINDLAGGILPARFPSETRGTLSANLLAQSREKNFYFRKMCITKNYASMIDDYFTMYGYAVRNTLTPNMNARPNFTYVKTKGCIVHCNCPAEDARAIEEMFDNGIRFWKNHNNIGNYNLPNAPV